MKIMLITALIFSGTGAFAADIPAQVSTLKDGDRLALVGDSITEICGYTRQLETYIELCSGLQDVKVFSLGWSGERAPTAAMRLENDILTYHPTIVTALYGCNDGEYSEYSDSNAKKYTDGLTSLAEQLKAKNIRFVISSPTCVDPQSFHLAPGGPPRAEMFNRTLAHMAIDAGNAAKREGVGFSDLHSHMFETMVDAKKQLGPDYIVCGDDGVHPGPNGSMLITLAYLQALGLDGTIAQFTMDAQTGKATVSAGHKLLSSAPGKIEVESMRYPYCFSAAPSVATQKHSVESILPFTDFQEKHNLFELKVTGLEPGRYTVSWGQWTKDFSQDQLMKGINLAAEFPANPFSSQFNQFFEKTYRKEVLELWSVKNVFSIRRDLEHYGVPDLKDKFDTVIDALVAKQAESAADLKKLHIPISYTITVEKSKQQ